MVVLDLTSSTLPLARLIPGTIHSPQLQRMPCHAYLPTLVAHFGHSRRPESAALSSSGRIQERGSRKRWAHWGGDGGGEEDEMGVWWLLVVVGFGVWGMRCWDVANFRLWFMLGITVICICKVDGRWWKVYRHVHTCIFDTEAPHPLFRPRCVPPRPGT